MTAPRPRRHRKSGRERTWRDLNRPRAKPTQPTGLTFESEAWFIAGCWLDDDDLDPAQEVSQWNHPGPQPAEAEAVLVEFFGDLDAARRACATLGPEVKARMPRVAAWLGGER